MSNFRNLSGGSFGGSFGGGDCGLSLTVPLHPHVGGPSPTIVGPGGGGGGSGSGPAEVRLAGVDTKEKMYEPKQRKKLVRVLTVVAYLFFVSLAAAMLSLYYSFLWNPSKVVPKAPKAQRPLTDEQLRSLEQAALRELQRIRDIQEQRRRDEQQRVMEQQEALQKMQRMQLRQAEQPTMTTDTESPRFSVKENADDDEELETSVPALMPVLRHRGVLGGELSGELGVGVASLYHRMDNDIPRVRAPPSAASLSHGSSEGAASVPSRMASRTASAFGGHKALRHANLHNLHGLRGLRQD